MRVISLKTRADKPSSSFKFELHAEFTSYFMEVTKMDEQIIIARCPTTELETSIGMRLNDIACMMNQLLSDLGENYYKKDPRRYSGLLNLYGVLIDAEADFFGFNSWDDLQKWKKVHGEILKEIEIE